MASNMAVERPAGAFLRVHRAVVLTLVLFALPVRLDAQPAPKVTRIGVLTPSSPAGSGHLVEAFRQGMRELGYVEGKTFVVETRYGEGRSERLPELARGLVSLLEALAGSPHSACKPRSWAVTYSAPMACCRTPA
jgi:hypothetical protein